MEIARYYKHYIGQKIRGSFILEGILESPVSHYTHSHQFHLMQVFLLKYLMRCFSFLSCSFHAVPEIFSLYALLP